MQSHNIISQSSVEVNHMFLTHRDCRNFRDGICILNGIPVNPNGPACPRFIAKNAAPPLLPQQTSVLYPTPSSQILKTETSETSFDDLKRRLDGAEAKIREIKAMLKRVR